jgi:hypothetical protein
MRKIHGWKMEEVTGDWRKLHNGEVQNCNSSSILSGL